MRKNLVTPSFVIVGGGHGDKAILLFSNTLYNIEINEQWDTAAHRSTTLNAEMSEYTQIVGTDFPQAWTRLFDHLRSPETPEHLRDLEYGVKMGVAKFSRHVRPRTTKGGYFTTRQGNTAWIGGGGNGGFDAFGKMSP